MVLAHNSEDRSGTLVELFLFPVKTSTPLVDSDLVVDASTEKPSEALTSKTV